MASNFACCQFPDSLLVEEVVAVIYLAEKTVAEGVAFAWVAEEADAVGSLEAQEGVEEEEAGP